MPFIIKSIAAGTQMIAGPINGSNAKIAITTPQNIGDWIPNMKNPTAPKAPCTIATIICANTTEYVTLPN